MREFIPFLLILTSISGQSVRDMPDFYAVKIDHEIFYTIFTRYKNCLIYESSRRKVLYLSGGKTWKIGKLHQSVESADCSHSNVVDQFEMVGSVLGKGPFDSPLLLREGLKNSC